ncbi:ATP-binding cassette transporter snq2 [Coemansia erecta]|nr:ATP-binding cassette transporter snq2 [Coemansia erecta]
MNTNNPFNKSDDGGSVTDRDGSPGSEELKDKRASSGSILAMRESEEPDMSFGEPLHVNVTRGTSRFKSIQRTYSKPLTLDEEEEMAAGKGSAFDLTTWLSGRQQQQGPPFATRVGLVFDELSVYGDNVSDRHIATVVTPVWKLLKFAAHGFGIPKLLSKSNDKHRLLLNKMSGVVEDGEMLLVLGRPGAGCSTLLRVLGNHRKTYRRIDGAVSYGGLTPAEVSKRYRGQVAYNAEEDMHHPSLTVRQTLDFAIQCKMPSTRMLRDRAGYKQEFLDTLLDMYGLAGCADTIVGNAFLRGVSGGERKRVSIAEQVASGAAVDVWDGSTRGLDSSSALDYVRSLRITTDVLRKATVVSIYQASENIYELFDKVMVVDEGRQLYYGPVSAAAAYFESLGIQKPPRQTTADFLTGVTQLDERRVVPGFEDSAPRTAEDFERAWLASSQCATVRAQVAAFEKQVQEDARGHEIREFVDQTKMGAGSNRLRQRSPYTSTIPYQFVQLFRREAAIMWGNRYATVFKFTYLLVFGGLVGALFEQLPETTDGAFLRAGVLFFSLLFSSLTAQAELPAAVTGRLVTYKQKSLSMFHPGVLAFVQTVADIPYITISTLLFSIILYFASGLSSTAGQFFAFVLFLLAGCLCLTALFRLIGNASPNLDIGHTASGVILLFSILLTGYLQPPNKTGWWFRWIYWGLNPLAYAYKSLMSNEFRNLNLECTGTSLIPNGPGFDNIENQVCTLQGARPGVPYVRGRDYIGTAYQFYIQDQWKDFAAVISYWIVFVIAMAIVMEFVEFGNTGYTIRVYKRYKPNVAEVTVDQVSTSKEAKSNSAAPTDEQILAGTTFTWKDLNYTVPVKGGERQLLNSVSGFIKPGQMTALMGSSGAGKTTLLDALSQRKTIGKLEGEVLMNGAELARSFRRSTGYAEQLDVHAPLVTVREALRFSAYLRQEASVPDSEKDAYVERVMFLLGLTDIANCLVGDPESGEGISLEERKRLTIGVELVSKPKILFLDEPTSGLDAQASFKIVQFLRRLAAEGLTILCTIHQPSSMLFEAFDRLLLLVRGGHTVYFGDIGDDARTLISYFERNGAPQCPASANPAEYILDVAGKAGSAIDWPQMWRDSPESQAARSEVDRINAIKHQAGADHDSVGDDRAFARSQLYQTKLVFRRLFLMQWRNVEYQTTRLALQVICALAIGFTFFNLGSGTADLQLRTMATFFGSILSILIVNQVIPEFIRSRKIYGRESSTNQYGWLAWSTAAIFSEWPFSVVSNTLYVVCLYWTVGLNPISDRVGYFYINYILLGFYSLTLGQAIASFSPNEMVASLVVPIASAFSTLMCGATVPKALMPKFFRSWLYYVSPFTYYLEGAISSELHGSKVVCKPEELYTFEPPSNSTCGDYAGEWVKQATGYITNLDATSACKYCPYSVGDEYLATVSWEFSHRWRNFGIMIVFLAFNIAFAIFMVRIYKVNKR